MERKRKQTARRNAAQSRLAKPYAEMTTAELREATREFDEPMVLERKSRPLTAQERAEYKRAVKRGRPKIGRGAKRVLITVEGGLLERADAFAERNGMTRSQLIARGLESVMGSAA